MKNLVTAGASEDETQRSERRARVCALVRGYVQGVGYRDFVRRRAQRLGITGYVRNRPRPDLVEVVAEGPRSALESLVADLRQGPSAAHVTLVEVDWESARGEFTSYEIRW